MTNMYAWPKSLTTCDTDEWKEKLDIADTLMLETV